MLEQNLKTQLAAYLEKLRLPIELVASLDAGEKSRELEALVRENHTHKGQQTQPRDGDNTPQPKVGR